MGTRDAQPAAESGEELLARFLDRYREPLRRYGRYVVVGLLAALVALLAYRQYRVRALSEQAKSWERLSELPMTGMPAMNPDGAAQIHRSIIAPCEKLLEERWETDATPWILLKLCAARQSAGRYEEVLEACRELQERFPDHYAAGLAERYVAAALEQSGHYEGAAEAYEKLASEPEESLRFWLDAGRCWELAGRREAARHAYEQLTGSPEAQQTAFVGIAESRLKRVATKEEPLLSVPPAPTPDEARQIEDAPLDSREQPDAGPVETEPAGGEPAPQEHRDEPAGPDEESTAPSDEPADSP